MKNARAQIVNLVFNAPHDFAEDAPVHNNGVKHDEDGSGD